MAGFDPAIRARATSMTNLPIAQPTETPIRTENFFLQLSAALNTWMAGSSPAMTREGGDVRRARLPAVGWRKSPGFRRLRRRYSRQSVEFMPD
jgi:hypothetical protein